MFNRYMNYATSFIICILVQICITDNIREIIVLEIRRRYLIINLSFVELIHGLIIQCFLLYHTFVAPIL